jgi:hypothetical protein
MQVKVGRTFAKTQIWGLKYCEKLPREEFKVGVVCTSQNSAIYGHLSEGTGKDEVIRGYQFKEKDKYMKKIKVAYLLFLSWWDEGHL